MRAFLEDHQEKRAEAEAVLDDLGLSVETDRAGDGLVPAAEE